MSEGYFKGMRGIEEVVMRMRPLFDFYKDFRPDIQHIAIPRKDFDLVRRWPKAAHLCGFDVTEDGIYYGGLRVLHDTSEARYGRLKSEQAVLE